MGTQVISIDREGGMTSLMTKPGKGIDLRQFGEAAINRSSLIEFCQKEQAFYIIILQMGPELESQFVSGDLWLSTHPAYPEGLSRLPVEDQETLYFTEYDKAVEAEVDLIQSLRIQHGKDFVL